MGAEILSVQPDQEVFPFQGIKPKTLDLESLLEGGAKQFLVDNYLLKGFTEYHGFTD